MRNLRLNDSKRTNIDLTKTKIRHFKWHNQYYIRIVFDSGEAVNFEYNSAKECRVDYGILTDLEWMVSERAIMVYPEPHMPTDRNPYEPQFIMENRNDPTE